MIARVEESDSQWRKLVAKCFAERVGAERFRSFAKVLYKQSPLRGHDIARLLLDSSSGSHGGLDPILWEYVRALIGLDIIHGGNLLAAVSEREDEAANKHMKAQVEEDKGGLQRLSVDFKERLLTVLCHVYATNHEPKGAAEAQETLMALCRWMIAVCESDQRTTLEEIQFQDPGDVLVQEALGVLFLTLAQTDHVRHVLDKALPHGKYGHFLFAVAIVFHIAEEHPEVGEKLPNALSKFVVVLTASSPQLANRLDFLQHSLQSLQNRGTQPFADSATDSIDIRELRINEISDRNAVRCRASLLIYLEAIVSDHFSPLLHSFD